MGALAFGSYRWRARLLPSCTGAQARLVEAVLMLSAVTVISELLGSMGAFRPVPVLVAMVGVGLGAGALAGPPEANSRSASAGSRSRPWSTTFALVAIAPV